VRPHRDGAVVPHMMPFPVDAARDDDRELPVIVQRAIVVLRLGGSDIAYCDIAAFNRPSRYLRSCSSVSFCSVMLMVTFSSVPVNSNGTS